LQSVGGAEGVKRRGQAGVEHAIKGKNVDANGNYGIKIGKFANTGKAAAGLVCAFRITGLQSQP
jgi:hypothetical protein